MDPQFASDGTPRTDPVDTDLIARSVAGDRSAFEALYRRHVDRVYGTCLRLTADRTEAEGLTQDTFVRAWIALAGFAGQGSLGGWLSRVAVNLWRDRIRRDKRHSRMCDMIAEETTAYHGRPSRPVGGGVAPLLTAMDLERAVAKLPPGARTVYLLHDVEGYKHAEIGAMLELAVGTVKAHLHRARRLLRGLLAEDREARNES